MAAEEDRLSDLPDNLLSYEILSRLSLRDAVASSILSSRWRSLWVKIPHLHFSDKFFASICPGKYTETVDNILRQHSAPLTSFRFDPHSPCKSNTRKIEEWIDCIRVKGVKEIRIKNGFRPFIQVPATLFSCQTLTVLKLSYLNLNEIPESCLGFPCLVSCSLYYTVAITKKNVIEKIIDLCPVLQVLGLGDCSGVENLKICAQNLRYLKLKYCYFDTLIVDCPQLMKLKVICCWAWQRDNSSFKVSCPVSLYDVNVSYSDFRLVESLSAAKTVRKFSIGKCKLPCVSGFLNTLRNFPGLEELTINKCIVEKRNMAAGSEMGIAEDINFPQLKEVCVDILCMKPGNEIAMLNFILQKAPSLKSMAINLLRCCPEVRSEISDLEKAFTEVEIRVLECLVIDAFELELWNLLNIKLNIEEQ